MTTPINVIVDVPLTFYRWVYHLSVKNKKFLTTEKDVLKLIQAVHGGLEMTVNKYRGNINRVVMCNESGRSWRKEILSKDESFYKETRKDHDFDMNIFKKAISTYVNILHDKGIYSLAFDGAEGDDMIFLSSNKIYSLDESVVIVTMDSDMKQLVKSDDSHFICTYNVETGKHLVDKVVELEEIAVVESMIEGDPSSIFDMDASEYSSAGKSLDYSVYAKCEMINPAKCLFAKLLGGDKSDNVPSVFYYQRKNGDLISFTGLRAESIFDKYYSTNDILFDNMQNDETFRRTMASKIIAEVKCTDLTKIPDISENIIRNLKFIRLHKDSYPPHFIKLMTDYIDKEFGDLDFYTRHMRLVNSGFNKSLLDNTEYELPESESYHYTEI